MRSHLFTLLFTFVCSSAVYAATEVLPYKTDVMIDGCNKEWNERLPKFDKKTGINYSVANNEKNLYFIIRIADEATQKQIMQNGMEVWINSLGKKKKVTGVTFPVPTKKNSKSEKNKQSEQNGQDNKKQTSLKMDQEISLPTNELSLTGFLIDNGKQSTSGCPVQAVLLKDQSGCIIYELGIPFNTFYKERLDKSDANVKFSFGFIIKGNDTSDENSEMGEMGGPGGGMGGPGGGMGMGGPGGGMGMGGPGGGMGNSGMSNQQQGSTNTIVSDKILWFNAFLNVK
jgi:hypothetical protein